VNLLIYTVVAIASMHHLSMHTMHQNESTILVHEILISLVKRYYSRNSSGDCMNPQDIMEKMQSIANDMQTKVGDAIRQSPAKDLEKNVRGLMTQGFQKLDLVTREEFDLQTQVLAKTRAKLEELEAKVSALEKK